MPYPVLQPGECRSCQAPIYWLKTNAGKRMPVDRQAKTVVTKDGETVTGHESHFSTCPQAGQWRRQ